MTELNIYGQAQGKSLPDWLPRATIQKVVLKGSYCLLEPIDIKHSKDLFEAWHCIDDERDWTYFHIKRPITVTITLPLLVQVRILFFIRLSINLAAKRWDSSLYSALTPRMEQ